MRATRIGRGSALDITVTVHDDGGFVVVATTTAYDPPSAPAGLRHHRHDRAPLVSHQRESTASDEPIDQTFESGERPGWRQHSKRTKANAQP
jgi:hypothetical protein